MGGASSLPQKRVQIFDFADDFAALCVSPQDLYALRASYAALGGSDEGALPLTRALAAHIFRDASRDLEARLRGPLFHALDQGSAGSLTFKAYALGLLEFGGLEARCLSALAFAMFASHPPHGLGPQDWLAFMRATYGAQWDEAAPRTQGLVALARAAAAGAQAEGGGGEGGGGDAARRGAGAAALRLPPGHLTYAAFHAVVQQLPSALRAVHGVQLALRQAAAPAVGEEFWERLQRARAGVPGEGGGTAMWHALALIRARRSALLAYAGPPLPPALAPLQPLRDMCAPGRAGALSSEELLQPLVKGAHAVLHGSARAVLVPRTPAMPLPLPARAARAQRSLTEEGGLGLCAFAAGAHAGACAASSALLLLDRGAREDRGARRASLRLRLSPRAVAALAPPAPPLRVQPRPPRHPLLPSPPFDPEAARAAAVEKEAQRILARLDTLTFSQDMR